jgi:sugar transferase (PEP-CTERM/EpsH1 system associated)
MSTSRRPLIAHIIHRLDVGGLENGLINLINHMPAERFQHAIICLTTASEFRNRIARSDVEVCSLNKRAGQDPAVHWRLWRLLRRLDPDIVHTRNLGTLESQWVAALAGVRGRVHGEHGWDVIDLDGSNRRYNALRRATRHVVSHYITMSQDLTRWLEASIGVRPAKTTQIYSGVDAQRFRPGQSGRAALPVPGFAGPDDIIIGTVGRMEPVKNPMLLLEAFERLLGSEPAIAGRLRLVMIGDGSQRQACEERVSRAGLSKQVWLSGGRADIDRLLQGLDVFVLPSLNEGISNTILEAMASGLPVVATAVGGNPELVQHEVTGLLSAPNDALSMCEQLRRYVTDASLRRRHGSAGRQRVEREFSLGNMVQRYLEVYERVLGQQA